MDIKDVDSGGVAVENDGTHLPVPTAGAPNTLAVPSTAPASPRYGSAQARSPGPRGLAPCPNSAGTGRFMQPYGATHFWQVWPVRWGDVRVVGVTPVQVRGDGKSLASCLHFLIKWLNFV